MKTKTFKQIIDRMVLIALRLREALPSAAALSQMILSLLRLLKMEISTLLLQLTCLMNPR